MIRIYRRASRSVWIVKQVPFKYWRKSVTAHTTSMHCLCVMANFRFLWFRVQDQSQTGLLLPSSCSCRSTYRIYLSQASVLILYGPLLFGKVSAGELIKASFNDAAVSISFSSYEPDRFGSSFLNVLLGGAAMRAKLGTNCLRTLH